MVANKQACRLHASSLQAQHKLDLADPDKPVPELEVLL